MGKASAAAAAAVVAAVVGAAVARWRQRPRVLRDRLVGSYTLASWTVPEGEKHAFGSAANSLGTIQYSASGHMVVILAQRQRTKSEAASLDPQDPAHPLAKWATEHFSYSGTYSVDEAAGAVTHHIRLCSHPEWIGTDLRRDLRFSDDDRVLELIAVNKFSGQENRLVWRRDPAA